MSMYDQSIFRALDIRGIYPTQFNESVAYAAGQAFVHDMKAKRVVVGHDVRPSGPSVVEAMTRGITDAGADVIQIGTISTEMLYFASATLDCDGGMSITCSHNPAGWNGVKFIGKNGTPLVRDRELGEMYDFINSNQKLEEFTKGSVEKIDILPRYVEFLQKFLPKDLPHLKIVANANFGANGKVVDLVTKDLPLEIIRLNWQEDGTFPKGKPDPLLPTNRKEVIEHVISDHADFGVAWDADADRVFFYDEKGRFISGYYICALLIKHFLDGQPGQAIVIEGRLTWANQDAIKSGNGTEVMSKTGHVFIKENMKKNNAIFGGENSGHLYYRDFWGCDNGMISFLTVLAIFSKTIQSGRPVSSLIDELLEKYPIIPQELNFITERAADIIQAMQEKYQDAQQENLDGISIEYPEWRFNLRMSNTEPVLRLNLEAHTQDELARREQELVEHIKSFGASLRDDSK